MFNIYLTVCRINRIQAWHMLRSFAHKLISKKWYPLNMSILNLNLLKHSNVITNHNPKSQLSNSSHNLHCLYKYSMEIGLQHRLDLVHHIALLMPVPMLYILDLQSLISFVWSFQLICILLNIFVSLDLKLRITLHTCSKFWTWQISSRNSKSACLHICSLFLLSFQPR